MPVNAFSYDKRYKNGAKEVITDHGPGPTAQPIPYYRRVGWNRTRRGQKLLGKSKAGRWASRVLLCSDGVSNFPVAFNDPATAPLHGASAMNPIKFRVKSQSEKNRLYRVDWTGASLGSSCTCRDYKWDQVCKHIRAVRRWRREQEYFGQHTVYSGALDGEILEHTFESDGEEDIANAIEAADRVGKISQFGSD